MNQKQTFSTALDVDVEESYVNGEFKNSWTVLNFSLFDEHILLKLRRN